MVVREYFSTRNDGVSLFRTYSDANLMIKKVGTNEIYSEAIDVEGSVYEYIETEESIIANENNDDVQGPELTEEE